MKKITAEIKINYSYDATHSGAHYTFDGVHYCNGGDFAEIITKSVLGFDACKDANTSYDKASDIQEINASVKSSRFTLVNMALADTFEETVNRYFETVHSNTWIYAIVIDNIANLYFMDAAEFKTFLYKFSAMNERKVIRGKATSGKMINWFEGQVA